MDIKAMIGKIEEKLLRPMTDEEFFLAIYCDQWPEAKQENESNNINVGYTNIVVRKSDGLIGMQVNSDFFRGTIDVLIKAATNASMAELTCDFKSNWEPFQNSKHYYKTESEGK